MRSGSTRSDLVHAVERQHEAAVLRRRAAGEPGAGAARGDRYVVCVPSARAPRPRRWCAAARSRRGVSFERECIRFIGEARGGAREHARLAEQRAQLVELGHGERHAWRLASATDARRVRCADEQASTSSRWSAGFPRRSGRDAASMRRRFRVPSLTPLTETDHDAQNDASPRHPRRVRARRDRDARDSARPRRRHRHDHRRRAAARGEGARPFVKTTLGKRFVAATADLPHIAPRTVWYDSSRTHYYTPERAAALPDTAKARMLSRTLDETFYYTTRATDRRSRTCAHSRSCRARDCAMSPGSA